MCPVSKRIEIERQHALHFIQWLDAAIYAINRADYSATRTALEIAKVYLDKAEGKKHERAD